MKIFKSAFFLWEIGIPYSHDRTQRKLSQENAIHPAEAELHVLDALVQEMAMQIHVQAMDQVFQAQDLLLFYNKLG